jgi:hypothetical protein
MFNFFKKIFSIIFGFNSKEITINYRDVSKNSTLKSIQTRDGLKVLKALMHSDIVKKSNEKFDKEIVNLIHQLVASHEHRIGDGTTYLSLFLISIYSQYKNSINPKEFLKTLKNDLKELNIALEESKITSLYSSILYRYINTTLKKDAIATEFIKFLEDNNITGEDLEHLRFKVSNTIIKDKINNSSYELKFKKTSGHIMDCYIPHAFRAPIFSVSRNVNISLCHDLLTVDKYKSIYDELSKHQISNTLLICRSIDTALYQELNQLVLSGISTVLIPVEVGESFNNIVRNLITIGLFDEELQPLGSYDTDKDCEVSKVKELRILKDRVIFDVKKNEEDVNRISAELSRLKAQSAILTVPAEIGENARAQLLLSSSLADIEIDIITNSSSRAINIETLLEDLIKGLKFVKDGFLNGRMLDLIDNIHEGELKTIIHDISKIMYKLDPKDISSFVSDNSYYIKEPLDLFVNIYNTNLSAISLLEFIENTAETVINSDLGGY